MPELKQIALADIDEPEYAVRLEMDEEKMGELCADMTRNGLLQPVGLKRKGERWEVEYGHRRLIAAGRLNWQTIPALCYEPGELNEGAALIAENFCREDVTAAEEALFIVRLQEKHGMDEAALCKAFGRSADWIGDRLKLLRGDEQIFRELAARHIGFAIARELNKCPDEQMRRFYLHEAARTGATARTVTQWVENYKATLAPSQPVEQSAGTSPAPTEQPIAPYRLECALCGGYKDPYNLVNVALHKSEWDDILRAYLRPVEG